jgi:hypothetical protein
MLLLFFCMHKKKSNTCLSGRKEKAATPKTNPVYQYNRLLRIDFGFVHAGVACLPDRQASLPPNLFRIYFVSNRFKISLIYMPHYTKPPKNIGFEPQNRLLRIKTLSQ